LISFTQIETALGSIVQSNNDISKSIGWSAEEIENKTGIKQRYVANINETAETLAEEAVKKFDKESLKDIDLIISVSNTQSIDFPNISNRIHSFLRLSENVQCFGINHGCSGFVDAILLIHSLFSSNFSKKALIVTSDTYQKFINENDRSIKTIFSDGAAATLLTKDLKTGWYLKNKVVNSQLNSQTFLERKLLNRDSEISMNGPQVLLFSINTVTKNLLSICPQDREFILFPHQAGKIVIESLKKKLPSSATILENYQEYGNLVSTSIPKLMEDNLNNCQENELMILSGFGVGLSHTSLLLEKNKSL
jgi:3-oxoacyl-[acyl-carrier-protein] synthase-3